MVAVTKWGGRVVLVAAFVAGGAIFARYSFTVESATQRTATGTVTGFGEYTARHKNKKYQVATVFVEYTDAGGTTRTIERDKRAELAIGAGVAVWYSPWSARDGRLTEEPNARGFPVVFREGLLAVLCLFGALFAWGLWRGLVGLVVGLRTLPGDIRAVRQVGYFV